MALIPITSLSGASHCMRGIEGSVLSRSLALTNLQHMRRSTWADTARLTSAQWTNGGEGYEFRGRTLTKVGEELPDL